MSLETGREFEFGLKGGILAGSGMLIFVEFFKILGLTRYDAFYIASETVFSHSNTWYNYALATLIHAGISVFWGEVLSLLMTHFFNKRMFMTKVVFCSFSIFFLHLGILDEAFHYVKEMHKLPLDMSVYLGGYIVYGFIFGFYLKDKIGKPLNSCSI